MWNSITIKTAPRPRAGNIRRLFNFITPTLGLRTTARKLETMTRSRSGELEVEVKKNGLYVDGDRLSWSRMVGRRLYGQIDRMSIELKGESATGRRLVRETMNAIILSKLKESSECFFTGEGIPNDMSSYSRNERIQLAGKSFLIGAAPIILLSTWGMFLWEGALTLGLIVSIPFAPRLYQKLLTYTTDAFQEPRISKKFEDFYNYLFQDIRDVSKGFKNWVKYRKP